VCVCVYVYLFIYSIHIYFYLILYFVFVYIAFRKYVYEVPIARCLARSGFRYVVILFLIH